jgi:pseudomonalisin/xanthomonalisin
LVFYSIPDLSDAHLAEAYSAAVSQNVAKVINVSLGECENIANGSGTMSGDDQIFKQAISQGQVFSVASGDWGADGCLEGIHIMQIPLYPATSPYVISVGGTTLTTDTTGTVWQSEVVWSDPVVQAAAGGGQSSFEAAAVFQTGYGILANGQLRGYPDVAFDADPNTGALVTGFGGETIGGTSLAAPLFTGFWARLQSAHGNSLPFAASAIYSTAVNTSAYAADFHDVTQGCNQIELAPCFEATTGWDKASGFGSLNVAPFSESLTASTGGNIFRLYEGILARVPDPAGEAFQIQAFEQGASLTTIASGMLASAEFANKFGSATQTNTGFVTQMYLNALHRQPQSSEIQFYVNLLTSGTSRGTGAVLICESPDAIHDWAAFD